MKFFTFVFLILTALSAFAVDYELSYKEHCESKTVVMDQLLIEDLLKIFSEINLEETMVARKKVIVPKKITWGSSLRSKLEAMGKLSRL